MNGRARAALLLMWIAGAAAGCGRPPSAPGAITATIEATPRAAAIGETVRLTITVTPGVPAALDLSSLPFTLAIRSRTDDESPSGRWHVAATSYRAGEIVIPALRIRRLDDHARPGPDITTPSLRLHFTAPSVSAADPLRPMSPRLEPDRTMARIVVGLAAAVVLALVALAARRPLARVVVASRRDRDWRRLVRGFDVHLVRLRAGAGRAASHGASNHLRRALGVAFDAAIPLRTTPQVAAVVFAHTRDVALAARVLQVLRRLDSERFAGDFDVAAAAAAVTSAHTLLHEIRPTTTDLA
jgi:hypothetical protein